MPPLNSTPNPQPQTHTHTHIHVPLLSPISNIRRRRNVIICKRVADFRGAGSGNTISESCLHRELLKALGQNTHVYSDVSVL